MVTPTRPRSRAAVPDHQILAAATAGVISTHAIDALISAPQRLVSANRSANLTDRKSRVSFCDQFGACNLARMSTSTTTLQRWICESCGFIYDPDEGDPDGGIPPGTAFEDIPDTWFCPVCGARKRDFVLYEE